MLEYHEDEMMEPDLDLKEAVSRKGVSGALRQRLKELEQEKALPLKPGKSVSDWADELEAHLDSSMRAWVEQVSVDSPERALSEPESKWLLHEVVSSLFLRSLADRLADVAGDNLLTGQPERMQELYALMTDQSHQMRVSLQLLWEALLSREQGNIPDGFRIL